MISGATDPTTSAFSQEPTGGWRELPPGVRLYIGAIVTITALTGVALLYYHLTSRMLNAQLWSPRGDNYGDFWHYHNLFRVFHTRAFFQSADRFAYPAPCAVIYALLYHAGPRPHLVFDLLLMLTFCGSGLVFFRVLMRFGMSRRNSAGLATLMMLTSYPWHTLYDRGNLELFVYIFLATGLAAYLTGRESLAAALWGCAGALKIYPLVMLVVFLQRRTLRPLLVGTMIFASVSLASFWYVGPTIGAAALGSLNGVLGFLGNYAASARRSELNLDHSVLGAAKELLTMHMLGLGTNWPNLSRAYQITVCAAGAILYLVRVRRLPALNQLCLLLVAIVLLPPVSYDYTLIHMYLVLGIVLGAYLYAFHRGQRFPGANAYFLAFALITTAQTWLQIRSLQTNGIIKCGALLALCWLLLRFPLRIGSESEDAASVPSRQTELTRSTTA